MHGSGSHTHTGFVDSNMFGEILQMFVFGTSLKKKLELPYAAGHYVPQLAELVYERNKDKKGKSNINLKGFIVRI